MKKRILLFLIFGIFLYVVGFNTTQKADLSFKIIRGNQTLEYGDLTAPININTASAELLALAPAIDSELAEKIVSYRNTHGNFNDLKDILKIKGISLKDFKQIKKYITV